MISIRAQLLRTLLPAFVGVTVLAGFGVYFSTKAELEARLDAQLASVAIDLRFAPEPPNREGGRGRNSLNREGGRNRDTPERDEPPERTDLQSGGNRGGNRGANGPFRYSDTLFTNLPSNVYCELWVGNRDVKLKSAELNGEISQPATIGDDPVFYDAALNDGSPFRVWASRLSVARDSRRPKVILAISREETDKTLQRLTGNLAGGSVAICLLLSGMLILALRISMKPLQKLGEQAATMDAESLHERFSETGVPSEIRPIVVRLNDLMAKLEGSFSRERRFSGDLAHELRTPLAAIRTTSEVAIKWPDQASAEDFEEIHKLSAGLQQTLDSLLLLSRMESSAAEKARETVDPAMLADECQALHAGRAEERGLRIELDSSQATELETDPRMLRIIMVNLIGNAVEYAPEGSVITIAVGGDALFQCANDAPNLTAEDVPRLFERMWRKDAARTESGHSGLGLSIAKACADTLNLELAAKLDDHGRLNIAVRS